MRLKNLVLVSSSGAPFFFKYYPQSLSQVSATLVTVTDRISKPSQGTRDENTTSIDALDSRGS